MGPRKARLACIAWRQLLLPTAIACGAGLMAVDGGLSRSWRLGSAAVFFAFAVLTAVTAAAEYRAATALRNCEPSYVFDGRWPTGFWSWLRNGLEVALQAQGMRGGAEGSVPDLLICGPGRSQMSPALRRTARLVVGVRAGDGVPAFDPPRLRELQHRQWHLMLYIARRATELRGYLVEPDGSFTLVPGGPSDDAFFAQLRRETLAHLPQPRPQPGSSPVRADPAARPDRGASQPGAGATADGTKPRRDGTAANRAPSGTTSRS